MIISPLIMKSNRLILFLQSPHLLQPVRPAALQLPRDAPREAPARGRRDAHVRDRVEVIFIKIHSFEL